MNESESLTCTICNKKYSSRSSLCNHNKRFHTDCIIVRSEEVRKSPKKVRKSPKKSEDLQEVQECTKEFYCRFCNKSYNKKNSRWSHEQKCKVDHEKQQQIIEETKKKELELQLKREEAEILRLKIKLQNSNKVDNVTLKKLNNMLLKHNNRIRNSTVNSHNTTNVQNNHITNNFQIVGFGREENINELLTYGEKRMILNSKLCSLEKLIEIVHCGNYNQFKNIIITNMKDNYMYKYDEGKGVFVLSTKQQVLNALVNYRVDDIDILYNEFLEKNLLDDRTKKCLEDFISKFSYDDKYVDGDGVEHENYKQYKINEIKVLLFNHQDKITNDISLMLSAEEAPPLIEEIK